LKRAYKKSVEIKCKRCGKQFKAFVSNIIRGRTKHCSWECARLNRIGKWGRSPGWKGKTTAGYVLVVVEGNKLNLEHRVIMERLVGRKLLRSELVHHKNGIKHDNRPQNLLLVTTVNHRHRVNCPKCRYEFGIR